MLPTVGTATQTISLIASLVSLVLLCKGRARGALAFQTAACVCLAMGLALLAWCFLAGDETIRYVAYYNSGTEDNLAWPYRFSGLWAGREGSLLLWTSFVSFAACAATRRAAGAQAPRFEGRAAALLCALSMCFMLLMLLCPEYNPFIPTPASCLDASGTLVGEASQWGLNPLLEHWAMASHPPLLFAGYAAACVPCCYALGAVFSGEVSLEWAVPARKWALAGLAFLTAGIALGSLWAYEIFGWGGLLGLGCG